MVEYLFFEYQYCNLCDRWLWLYLSAYGMIYIQSKRSLCLITNDNGKQKKKIVTLDFGINVSNHVHIVFHETYLHGQKLLSMLICIFLIYCDPDTWLYTVTFD